MRERQRPRHIAAGAGLTAGAFVSLAAGAQANSYTVTNLDDGPWPGPAGSLRKAFSDANAHPGADTILFASSLSGTVDMTYTQPFLVYEALDIQGPGADEIALNPHSNSRILVIDPATPGDAVTVSGLSLFGGSSSSPGGAIVNYDAKLAVEDSLFSGNQSSADLWEFAGGAIGDFAEYADGAETTIRNSTFLSNSTSGKGGAIGTAGQLGTITNSSFISNDAEEDGGAIYTVTGGTILNSTIARNDADGSGGGIADGNGGSDIVIKNSIVSDNEAADSGPDLSGGDPFSVEFSLIEDTSGATIDETVLGSNITGTDPELSTFTYESRSALSLLPDYTSPVLDQGMVAGGETTDQRGKPRPFDLPSFPDSSATGADGSDMGAVELTLDEATPVDLSASVSDSPDPVTEGQPLAYEFEVQNNGPNDATGVVLTEAIPGPVTIDSTLSGDCSVTSTSYYGSYIDCDIGALSNGDTATRTLTVTPLREAAYAPYISAYISAFGDQTDPDWDNNVNYADTVVLAADDPPLTNPPPPPPKITDPSAGKVAAAIRKCKKKFRGKKRQKCIKRVKGLSRAEARDRMQRRLARRAAGRPAP